MTSLENLQGRDYVVEARRRGGMYYLNIQELGVFASAETYVDAFAELEERKTRYFEHHISCGTISDISLPREARQKQELRPFFIKATVVALVGVFLFSAASISFTYALREPVRKLGQRTGKATIKQFTGGVKEFVSKEITPEKEEKIRLAIREAIPKLKPYMEELRPLFDTDNTRP